MEDSHISVRSGFDGFFFRCPFSAITYSFSSLSLSQVIDMVKEEVTTKSRGRGGAAGTGFCVGVSPREGRGSRYGFLCGCVSEGGVGHQVHIFVWVCPRGRGGTPGTHFCVGVS